MWSLDEGTSQEISVARTDCDIWSNVGESTDVSETTTALIRMISHIYMWYIYMYVMVDGHRHAPHLDISDSKVAFVDVPCQTVKTTEFGLLFHQVTLQF